jgi:hypothetical protein
VIRAGSVVVDMAYFTARDQFAALLPAQERVVGTEHPSPLAKPPRPRLLDRAGGDAAAARNPLAALLPIRERLQGPKHLNTVTIRHQLAYWTRQPGDSGTALGEALLLFADAPGRLD